MRWSQLEGIGHGIRDERMADITEPHRHTGLSKARSGPTVCSCAERCDSDRGIDVAHGGDRPQESRSADSQLSCAKEDRIRIEKKEKIEVLVNRLGEVAGGE